MFSARDPADVERFFRGLPAQVTGDGVVWPQRSWKILTVGAVDQIGLGFRPTPGVLTHPGGLHAFMPGAQEQVVGIAQDDLGFEFGFQ